MLVYPIVDPIALYIGSWPVYWYGLMYLFSFITCWGILRWRIQHLPWLTFTDTEIADIAFYAALGAILGGRLGYMLFYDFHVLIDDPIMLFKTWMGGMSFHGGFLGVLFAIYFYARHIKKSFWEMTDFIAPVIPIGLAAGRIGNFINGELWGRATDVSWAMIFPHGGNVTRHPSQLYEMALEGILLFFILWFYSRKPRVTGKVSAVFLMFYGLFRIAAECFREPDQQIGFYSYHLTQGQLLSAPMVIIGIILFLYCCFQKPASTNS